MKDGIIIYCAMYYGEEIYFKLISKGYHVIAFCDNAITNENIFLFGLPVYNYAECSVRYPDAVYVIAHSKYATAIEIGMELEKDGLVKDSTYYIAIELELQGLLSCEQKGIQLALQNRTVILFGNTVLCHILKKWLQDYICNIATHICSSEQEIKCYMNNYPDAIWISLEKGDFVRKLDSREKSEIYLQKLKQYGIFSFSRFFSNHMIYCTGQMPLSESTSTFMEQYNCQVKRVVFLKTSSFSGSFFLNSILDSHPNILYFGGTRLGIDIWYIVKKAFNEKKRLADTIVSLIEQLQPEDPEWLNEYKKILDKYLSGSVCSEKDLFMVIHFAYYEFLHDRIPSGEMIIYMDIHSNMVMRDAVFSWLDQMGFEIMLLEMIRNPYKRLGSAMKRALGENRGTVAANTILNLLYEFSGEHMDQAELKYPLIRIRFEDLKLFPRMMLEKLCDILGISWDDCLLETTSGGTIGTYVSNGDKVTGFDLKPVYYSYDEYFDDFDKFRLNLIFREKSRAYRYSYVEKDKYPMPLEELGKFFELPFCFEKFVFFKDEAARIRFRKNMRLLCTRLLYFEENKEKYKEHFQFGEYLTV